MPFYRAFASFKLLAAASVVRRATAITTASVVAENSEDSNDKDDPPKTILVYKIKATAFHFSFPPNHSLQLHTMLSFF